MKKIMTTVILSVMLAMMFTACGNKTVNKGNVTETMSSTNTTENVTTQTNDSSENIFESTDASEASDATEKIGTNTKKGEMISNACNPNNGKVTDTDGFIGNEKQELIVTSEPKAERVL